VDQLTDSVNKLAADELETKVKQKVVNFKDIMEQQLREEMKESMDDFNKKK